MLRIACRGLVSRAGAGTPIFSSAIALFALLALLALFPLGCSERGFEENRTYTNYCAGCHESDAVEQAPSRPELAKLTPEQILAALETGVMLGPGRLLSSAQKREVAEYLGGRPLGAVEPEEILSAGLCPPDSRPDPVFSTGPGWNGWGVDLANTRFQPQQAAGLAAEDLSSLQLLWAFGLPATIFAQAQPVVVGGLVFVGTPRGTVYALDSKSGCIRWSYDAGAGVRSAISVGRVAGSGTPRYAAYFGDFSARVHAVDASTGERIWQTRVDEHENARITGAPQLHDGRLYIPVSSLEHAAAQNPSYECCRFRGSVVALDANTGRQIWKTYTIPEPAGRTLRNQVGTPMWGPSGASVWNAPTLDEVRGALYVGTGNNYSVPASAKSDSVLALDLKTGRVLWARQFTSGDAWNAACATPDRINCPWEPGPDVDVAASTILRPLPGGGRVLVVGQKSGVVYGLNPDAGGALRWKTVLGQGGNLGSVIWGAAADDEFVYVSVSVVVRGKPEFGGGLYALRLDDGTVAWHTPSSDSVCGQRPGCNPAQSAAVTAIPGVVFSGSRDGHLRAYSAATGQVLWDLDTVRDYETVNGIAGRGGSLNAAGPAVVGGVIYLNSGYGAGGMAGNVLLALRPE